MNEQKQIESLKNKAKDLFNQAMNEGRAMNKIEQELFDQINDVLLNDYNIDMTKPMPEHGTPLACQIFGEKGGGSGSQVTGKPFALRGPNDKKDYNNLFGSTGFKWQDQKSNFFDAVFSGRHHPELIRGSMVESIPSSGGFLVPTEYAKKIHNIALESEIVMPRAYVQPMTTLEMNIPAMTIGSNATSLYGGFQAIYKGEAASLEEKNPKVRNIHLVAQKLTGLLRFSNELVADSGGNVDRILQICGEGLGWYRDYNFINGNGANGPLGILNCPCVVEVAKEDAQADNTITYRNLTTMLSKLWSGSFNDAVWLAHPTCMPQLLELTIPIGTAGSLYPVLSESDGKFRCLTKEILFTEKMPSLGNRGDIALVDLRQYVVGLRQGMRFDVDGSKYFETDEVLARLIERHCGQGLWSEALTLKDGSTQASPFVVLGAR